MWLLFAWVAANQGGVPIPVVPPLIGAGAVVVAVSASLTADLAWYGIRRWRGAQALALLGKLSQHAAARVKIAERRFVAHQLGFLFGARWMPEANPVAAGLAGADRIALGRYILIVMTTALVWVGTLTGVGYALGNVTTGLPTPFGVVTTFIAVAVAIASIGFVLKHRRRHSILRGPANGARATHQTLR